MSVFLPNYSNIENGSFFRAHKRLLPGLTISLCENNIELVYHLQIRHKCLLKNACGRSYIWNMSQQKKKKRYSKKMKKYIYSLSDRCDNSVYTAVKKWYLLFSWRMLMSSFVLISWLFSLWGPSSVRRWATVEIFGYRWAAYACMYASVQDL